MTKRQRILIFVAAGVSLLTIVGTMGWFVYVGVKSATSQKPTTEEEKRLVVTAPMLQEFGLEVSNPQAGKFETIRQFDQSRIISYEFRDGAVYINSTTHVSTQVLTGRQMFQVQKLGMRSGLGMTKRLQVVETPSLLTLGDERYAALVKNEQTGEPVGNILILRQGSIVYSLTMVGFYFDEAKGVTELFEPLLRESAAQRKR